MRHKSVLKIHQNQKSNQMTAKNTVKPFEFQYRFIGINHKRIKFVIGHLTCKCLRYMLLTIVTSR